jgi:hypothetical protein
VNDVEIVAILSRFLPFSQYIALTPSDDHLKGNGCMSELKGLNDKA